MYNSDMFFFYLLISLAYSQGYEETIYKWQVSDENPYKGQCYEIDKPTYGQKYAAKVSKEKCRPNSTSFHWEADLKNQTGKCYEIDQKSKGQEFSIQVTNSKCIPTSAVPTWIDQYRGNEGACFYIDEDTHFLLKTSKSKCLSNEKNYQWVPLSPTSGRCFQYSQNNPNLKTVVSKSFCRPKSLTYSWFPDTKDPSSGKCLEVDAEGVSQYTNTVDASKCIKKSLGLKWNSTKEECFEIFELQDGGQFFKKIDYKKCRPDRVEYQFVRLKPFSGICREIDSVTKGLNFSKTVALSKCRPTKLEYTYIKQQCFEFDPKDQKEGYIRNTAHSYCTITKSAKAKWYPDEKDPWKGFCKIEKKLGERSIFDIVSHLECRPRKVFKTWHNKAPFKGSCYEVDPKEGPIKYSYQVPKKKCRPVDIVFVYRKDKKGNGQCWEVDTKTKGEKYHRQIGTKNCKDKQLWNPEKL